MAETTKAAPQQIMALIQNTHPMQIADLDAVRLRYIQNYNQSNREKVGDLMYHRQVIIMKQLLAESPGLQGCDKLSLYKAFMTIAIKNYSLAPEDGEVYLVPLKGKAVLWLQAGAHVKRLMQIGQITSADQAKLVYQGDEFLVEKGRVIKHVEKYASEVMVAGYIIFHLDDKGTEKHFTYRKSDWEGWRKKSQNTKTDNPWTSGELGQPEPGFLRTKIVKHACTDKSWPAGYTAIHAETILDVEYDELPDDTELPKLNGVEKPAGQPVTQVPVTATNGHSYLEPDDVAFANQEAVEAGVVVESDDF